MQLKSTLRADSTQGGPLIAAVWGNSATGAVQMVSLDDDNVAQQSARGQVCSSGTAAASKGSPTWFVPLHDDISSSAVPQSPTVIAVMSGSERIVSRTGCSSAYRLKEER